MTRRTRIVATLGPATDRPGVLERLLDAGLDVARINFSHGAGEEPRRRIQQVRQLAEVRKRQVAILADLPGPKLRAILGAPLTLTEGQSITIARTATAGADIHLTEPELLAAVKPGERILFDDGRLQGSVTDVGKDIVAIKVKIGGPLAPNKGINLPDTELAMPAITQRDRDAIAVALDAGVDWFALSFVRSAAAADDLRQLVGKIPVLAKIERPEAVARADQIIDAFDGIMVARGDLGVEIALEKVPHVQKLLIDSARRAGKPVITATDMLDSMRKNPRPTRAEVSDVANAVYDGSSAVMLSGETAVGEYPVETLTCMTQILCEAETNQEFDAPRRIEVPRGSLHDLVTHAAYDLAHTSNVAAIITPTLSGRTACLVARHRPKPAIIAVASDLAVVRRLSLVWGVSGVQMPFALKPGEDRLEAAVRAAYLAGAVAPGMLVVLVAQHPIEGAGICPTIRLERVGADGHSCEAIND